MSIISLKKTGKKCSTFFSHQQLHHERYVTLIYSVRSQLQRPKSRGTGIYLLHTMAIRPRTQVSRPYLCVNILNLHCLYCFSDFPHIPSSYYINTTCLLHISACLSNSQVKINTSKAKLLNSLPNLPCPQRSPSQLKAALLVLVLKWKSLESLLILPSQTPHPFHQHIVSSVFKVHSGSNPFSLYLSRCLLAQRVICSPRITAMALSRLLPRTLYGYSQCSSNGFVIN